MENHISGGYKGVIRCTFRLKASGEVTDEIINEKGEVVSSKSFGIIGEEGYRGMLKLIEQEFPDIGQIGVMELMGN